MDGGFSLNFTEFKKKFGYKPTFGDTIRQTKKSEMELINSYEEYDDKTKKYNKAYDNHITNLKALDDYVNFKGMETLFKKIIMKDNFKTGHVDRSNPLLFKNYLIETDVPPSTLRKEHILQQVRYILNKYFPSREHLFIKYMDVEVGKSAFMLNIVTVDDIKKSRKVNHDEYIVNKSETKKVLNDVLSAAKKNLKRESIVIQYDNNSDKSGVSSFKSKDKSDYKSRDTKKTKRSKIIKNTKSIKESKKSFNKLLNNMIKLDIESSKSRSKSKSKSKKTRAKKSVMFPEDINKTKKESTKKKKISMYMTKSEKEEERDAKREAAKEAEKAKLPLIPTFGQDLGRQNIDFGLQAEQVLAGNVPPISQPMDPENMRCDQFSASYDSCISQNCMFRNRKCIKKEPRPQLIGIPPPEQSITPYQQQTQMQPQMQQQMQQQVQPQMQPQSPLQYTAPPVNQLPPPPANLYT